MKGWLIFQLKWFQIHAFVNLFIFFTLHLHGNIRTVSVFRFKKRLLAKVKKKCLKSLSKSHSCPCWVFQTRHTSKFCSAKKMAETPCFVSVLLLEESFAVTYHNSRVRRVNSFQTSLFFHPRLWNLFFWSTRGSYLTYFIKIFMHYRSNFKVLSKLSDGGSAENTAGICFLIGNSWKLDFWP